jgi:dihydrodipicolinate synthase/N-acetylneuraminate lyase
MNKHSFCGTGVAIITPFLENGDMDQEGLEKLI